MEQPDDSPGRLLQAQWILGETRPEQVPDVCTHLLAAGFDTPSLRVLANLTRAELERVAELLPNLFREMGMGQPTLIQAAWRIAQNAARDILAGRVTPYEGARTIGDFGSRFEPLFPSLSIFIGLWSEWGDDPGHRQEYESDIRSQAMRLVAEAAPTERGTGSEVDRLVQLAKEQTEAGPPRDMSTAAKLFAGKIPAGHILPNDPRHHWTAIGSHNDRLVLLLHAKLPFGFIRPEYRGYIGSVSVAVDIQLAEVASAEAAQLSLTRETLKVLAGREVTLPHHIGWLSANQVRDLTQG